MNIPIIVICHNNYKYVDNTLNQIKNININYYKNIQILDNLSTDEKTIEYLKSIDCNIIYNKTNTGPWINPHINSHIFDILPDKFIVTDPDLEFNKNLPSNFIEILSYLSDIYSTNKIGFALDISDFDKMYDIEYCNSKTIYDWENQFWKYRINNEEYELYSAPIDTTFALINKLNGNFNIRIAGNFTAKHIPWYIDNKFYNIEELYEFSKKQTKISSISRLIIRHMKK